jgi:hypothetical protein
MASRMMVAVAGLAALVVAACGNETAAREEPTPRPISAECRGAFEAATELEDPDLGREDEQRGIGRGSLLYLEPTLEACQTTTEWFEAYRAYASEATEGIPPSSALRTLCRTTRDEALQTGSLCSAMADAPDDRQPGDA